MIKTVKREMRTKAGKVIPKGSTVSITPTDNPRLARISCGENQVQIRASYVALGRYLKGYPVPSIETMEKRCIDGIDKSIAGKRVELDGCDPSGYPSWSLALGII